MIKYGEIMIDKDYFNVGMFLNTNKDLRDQLKEIAEEEKTPLYLIIDEAMRDLLKSRGKKQIRQPRVPRLVEVKK